VCGPRDKPRNRKTVSTITPVRYSPPLAAPPRRAQLAGRGKAVRLRCGAGPPPLQGGLRSGHAVPGAVPPPATVQCASGTSVADKACPCHRTAWVPRASQCEMRSDEMRDTHVAGREPPQSRRSCELAFAANDPVMEAPHRDTAMRSARAWRSRARSVWSAPARAGALAGAQRPAHARCSCGAKGKR